MNILRIYNQNFVNISSAYMCKPYDNQGDKKLFIYEKFVDVVVGNLQSRKYFKKFNQKC